MTAFSLASPSTQLAWRAEFESGKSKMMSSTLTVENRSGRRFDRERYEAEAQLIYGASLVPDGASPKLLARCFKHSVDFIVSRGLVSEPADSALLSTPGSPDARKRLRQPSLSSEEPSALLATMSRSPSVSLPAQAPGGDLSCDLFVEDPAFSLDDMDVFLEETFGFENDSGMLLDTCDVRYTEHLLSEAGTSVASELASQPWAQAVPTLPGACLRSVSVESRDVSGASTLGSQAVQVEPGMGCAQQLEALRWELAATKRDLAEARAQRDAAVRQMQAAGAVCASGDPLQHGLA